MSNVIGKCPKCGGDVITGKFGAYCKEKCGMSLGMAFGVTLNEEQVKAILNGEKIFVSGLKSKAGKEFDAFLIPDGLSDYSYTSKKNNEVVEGTQFKFKMEFPEKDNGGEE